MSNIYIMHDEDGNQVNLVSKEYVDAAISVILNALINKDNNTLYDYRPYDFNEVALDTSDKNIDASIIKQDTNHRFATDALIQEFKNKPTLHEVNSIVNDAKNNMQAVFNDQYIRMLNIPEAVPKLLEVVELINNNKNLDTLISAMQDKMSKHDLEEHEKSNIHITNEDREALSALIELVKDGTIAKIKDLLDPTKDSVPHAENSDKLDGMTKDELFSEYGMNNIITEDNINTVVKPGVYRLKSEEYNIENVDINFKNNTEFDRIIITGCGPSSKINCKRLRLIGNISLINCSVNNANVNCRYYNVFDNITFINCNININGVDNVSFKNCYFKDCVIKFNGSCRYIKFTDNYFNKTKLPEYIGYNNIYESNIFMN